MSRRALLALLLMLLLLGCAPARGRPQPTAAPPPPPRTLRLLNWDTYMDPALLARFEAEQGVTIETRTFVSGEELLATLRAEPTHFDLIVPPDYLVEQMAREGQLRPLVAEALPNLANLAPDFRSPAYDPGNRYCIPYQWGTVGIGYRRSAVAEPRSWQALFDPANSGRVALLDDPRQGLAVGLLALGFSPNSSEPTQIGAARDLLLNHVDHIAALAPDSGQALLADGTVDLALEYSGDILQLAAQDPDIGYQIPQEGAIVWTDALCVPIGAAEPELAMRFINYLLEPEIGAALSNFIRYSTPNEAAFPLINAEDRSNPQLYPSPEMRERLFFLVDVGPETQALYDAAWGEVVAAHAAQQP